MMDEQSTWHWENGPRNEHFSQAEKPLLYLVEKLDKAGVSNRWLGFQGQAGSAWALCVERAALREALDAAGDDGRGLRGGTTTGPEMLLAVSAAIPSDALERLGEAFASGTLEPWVDWLALDSSLKNAVPLLEALEERDRFLATGRIVLHLAGRKPVRFEIYRAQRGGVEAFEAAAYSEKRGEGPGHLQGREDYFQKRSGRSKDSPKR